MNVFSRISSRMRSNYVATHPKPDITPLGLVQKVSDTLSLEPHMEAISPSSLSTAEPDATHTAQWEGRWWAPALASALADKLNPPVPHAEIEAAAKQIIAEAPVYHPEPVQPIPAISPPVEPETTPIPVEPIPVPEIAPEPIVSEPPKPAAVAAQPKETIVATTPVTPAAPHESGLQAFNAKVKSVLDKIGDDVLKGETWAVDHQAQIHGGVVTAEVAAGIVNPLWGAAIAGADQVAIRVFQPIVDAQKAAAALGNTATGEEKLAYAAPAVAGILEQFPQIAGKTPTDIAAYKAEVTNIASSLAKILKLYPATADLGTGLQTAITGS